MPAGPAEEFSGLRRHANNEVAHLVIGVRTLEPTDCLRNIGEQVAATFDIRVRVKRADNKPQICCDRLFTHERVDATLFDLSRQQIDLVVTGNKLIGECDIALEHRCGDLGDPVSHHLDHLEQVAFDQGDALIEWLRFSIAEPARHIGFRALVGRVRKDRRRLVELHGRPRRSPRSSSSAVKNAVRSDTERPAVCCG